LARIGPISFLISGAVAVAGFFLYMRVLAFMGHDRYRVARKQIAVGTLAIAALINAFYFVKIFPPLPLVLSDAGLYHSVKREGRDFQVTAEDEPPRWRALFGTFPVLHMAPGEKLYLYSAVFAPSNLRTRIVHEWQSRNAAGDWTTQQRILIPIFGGREDGFRFYTSRTAPQAGQWRVNIATLDGRAIGRMRFSVETVPKPPSLATKTLN
jgi:hypothetical protein